MDDWHRTFRHRMSDFEDRKQSLQGALSVSIKLRVTGGCYHREHSPHAYEIIDRHLRKIEDREEFAFEEHESGPELLVFVAAATAGISLAKSIIDLIIAIIKARSEGINPTTILDMMKSACVFCVTGKRDGSSFESRLPELCRL